MGTPLVDAMVGRMDGLEALQRVLSSRHGPGVKSALIYALEGAGYRLAARLAGLRESRAKDLHRAAKRLGILEIHLDRKVELDAQRYSKRDRAALEAFLRDPEKATLRQLVRASRASEKRVRMLEGRSRAS